MWYLFIFKENIICFYNHDVDLYILDIRLPDGTGIDVCNDLKNNPETSHISVILMSAHAKVYEIDNYCKANAFVTKPFDIATMTTIHLSKH